MVIVIAEIPFEEFIIKTERQKENYLDSQDIFFVFSAITPDWAKDNNYTKRNIKELCQPTLEWCILFHEAPLYFWVMQTNYWYKITPEKYKNYFKISRWHDVPTNSENAMKFARTDNWKERKENVDKLFCTIETNNFNKNPIVCEQI